MKRLKPHATKIGNMDILLKLEASQVLARGSLQHKKRSEIILSYVQFVLKLYFLISEILGLNILLVTSHWTLLLLK